MRKKLILLSMIAMLLPVAVSAQQGFSFMSFELGGGMGVRMGDTIHAGGLNTFGINFRLADPLIIGVSFNNGILAPGTGTPLGNLTMFNIKYDVMPLVRATMGFGSAGTGSTAFHTGLGFEVIPFRREVGGLFTEFKLAPRYYFVPATANGISNGVLLLGLALSVGF